MLLVWHLDFSFDDVSMESNQTSNPLDYSQSTVAYKDLNGNSTGSTNIITDTNGPAPNLLNQVSIGSGAPNDMWK